MTAEPPSAGHPYEPPPPGGPYGHPQGGGYGDPYSAQVPYGAPQGAPFPPGAAGPLAKWWERLVARIIDGLIFGIIYWILLSVLTSMFGPSAAEILADPALAASGTVLPGLLAGIIGFGAYAGYDYALHSKDGQTLGKKVMKIRLAGVGGGAPDSSALLRRSAIYPGVMVLNGIPFVGWLASIFVLVLGVLILVDKPMGQGLHDKLAGTVVVRAPR